MSLAPDPSDKTDAKADGNFGSAGGSHRAGYGDKLANAERWARKGGTLNAGEGAILCEEIDRLRDELTQQSITLSAEHQRAEHILAALREPSETVVHAALATMFYDFNGADEVAQALRAAVAAAAQEVQGE